MTMTVIETRLQILHIWIMQQTMISLMHLQQSMLVDTETSWVKMAISLLALRMHYRRTLSSYLTLNSFESEKIIDSSDCEKGL